MRALWVAAGIGVAVGSCCWGVAVISLLATQGWMWEFLGAIQRAFGETHQLASPCWLCGMSRAFRAIWQGDLAEAARLNVNAIPLFYTVIVGCALGPVGLWGLRDTGDRGVNTGSGRSPSIDHLPSKPWRHEQGAADL